MAELPARAWQRMLSGRRLDLLDPSPLDIEIGDIALGLSRVARWNGQTIGPHGFSVAQHCSLVVRLMGAAKVRLPRPARLAGLLHDAGEYVTSDLITPFKNAIGGEYKALEKRLERAVHLRFGLPAVPPEEWSAAIKRADKTAAFLEAVQLAGFGEDEARQVLGYRRKAPAVVLEAWEPETARQRYLEAFRALGGGDEG
ncbi:MAG: HD family hydrolase [Alphaproteobacteria bacterium]|nr:HD family hydrolase [Alphaproteobacteria bacterium]